MSSVRRKPFPTPSAKANDYWRPLVVILSLSIFLQIIGTLEEFRLETATAIDQPWRLITGHLIHVGWTHLVINIIGAIFIWILVGRAFNLKIWLLAFVMIGATVNLGLINLSNDVEWYAGLSGILHGLIVAGVLVRLERSDYLGFALLGGITAKFVLEWHEGGSQSMATLIGARVISDAHVYGAFGGLLFSTFVLSARRLTRTLDDD